MSGFFGLSLLPCISLCGIPRSALSRFAKVLDFVDNRLRKRGFMATARASVIAGYSFDRSPDLTDPKKVREQLSGSAIKGFIKIAAKWDLTESQARGLLGGIASSTFHAWKSEPNAQKLSQDTLFRISLVIGIYKALLIYFGEEWADRWVTLENRLRSMFAGIAPIEYADSSGQPGMSQVRPDVRCLARRPLRDPPVRSFRWEGSHRLIPSLHREKRYLKAKAGPCSQRSPGTPKSWKTWFCWTAQPTIVFRATSEIHRNQHLQSWFMAFELSTYVNAAYTHPNESGSRFNDPTSWSLKPCRGLSGSSIAKWFTKRAERLGDIIVPGEPGQRHSAGCVGIRRLASGLPARGLPRPA